MVVYGEHGASRCIDAFAVDSGREPRIRDAAAALLRMIGTPDALVALERAGTGE